MEFLGSMVVGAIYGAVSWFVLSVFFSIANIPIPDWALVMGSFIVGLIGALKADA